MSFTTISETSTSLFYHTIHIIYLLCYYTHTHIFIIKLIFFEHLGVQRCPIFSSHAILATFTITAHYQNYRDILHLRRVKKIESLLYTCSQFHKYTTILFHNSSITDRPSHFYHCCFLLNNRLCTNDTMRPLPLVFPTKLTVQPIYIYIYMSVRKRR